MAAATNRTNTQGIAVVLMAGLSISLSNVLTPLVYDAGGNPLSLLIWRFLAFLLLCGLWLKLRGVKLSLPRRDLRHCYGAGLFYALGAGSLLASIAELPVSLAVLIFYNFPLLTFLFVCLLNRQRPSILPVLCLLAAWLGLALALQVEGDALSTSGLGFGALAAISMAVAYTWSGQALSGIDSRVSTIHMAVVGALLAALVTLLFGEIATVRAGGLNWLILLGAVISFAVAFFGMFSGVKLIGSARTAMLMNLEPVFTIILAVLLLSHGLSATQWLGAALVIGAVFIGQKGIGGKRKGEPSVLKEGREAPDQP